MNWLSKERKDTSLHIMFQKKQKLKRKLTFDIPKFILKNGLEQKTSNFWVFLRQTFPWVPNPPKNVQVFFAASESYELCRDFGGVLGTQSEMVV